MANPALSVEQHKKADELLAQVRASLAELADGDPNLLFAYRRKVAKMLNYDERSGPKERGKLKRLKMVEQSGACPICAMMLPSSYNVLDRLSAVDGYTLANTRLICETCDRAVQRERRFK